MSNTTQETQLKTGNSQSPSSHQRNTSTRPPSQGSRSSNGKNKANRGNSKYAQKSRGKSKAPVAVKPRGPVNTYTSVCCSLPATKPAAASSMAGSKEKTGLGHFRCSGCRKGCKVTVSKFKVAEAVTGIPTTSDVYDTVVNSD